MPKGKQRGAVGKDEILDAAFTLFATAGDPGFSVRKVAASVGVDPMTVLHYFGSKHELIRQIADRALASVVVPPATHDWRTDLRAVAIAYRELAHRHPHVFHLHFRFHATGPVDHESSEIVYDSMRRAGLPDDEAAGVGLAFYAFVLGFALAETEGLLRPITSEDEAELMALDSKKYVSTQALVPAFKALNPNDAFDSAIEIFLAGLAMPSPNHEAAQLASKCMPRNPEQSLSDGTRQGS
ncbi:MAG: TetR family transcriptional regulator [Hyphomicrobium sp.]|nr:MAG: TetR family transcriptional regulator [Hyphomicrobium sp.]